MITEGCIIDGAVSRSQFERIEVLHDLVVSEFGPDSTRKIFDTARVLEHRRQELLAREPGESREVKLNAVGEVFDELENELIAELSRLLPEGLTVLQEAGDVVIVKADGAGS